MRKRPLLLGLCVFCIGILTRQYRSIGGWVLLGSIILYDVIRFGANMCHRKETQDVSTGKRVHRQERPRDVNSGIRKRTFRRAFLLLLIFVIAYLRMHQNVTYRENYLTKLTDGDEVTVWGEIYKSSDLDDKTSRIYLTDCYVALSDSSNTIPCNDVMVYVSSADYQAGIILKVKGQFHNFKVARNEGNFDSRSFYQSQKIDFYVEADVLSVLGDNQSGLARWILALKQKISFVYATVLPEKTAGLLQGIVLGDKTTLDEEVKELFTEQGIVHILTVSGLHVSVLGQGIYRFLRKRRWSFLSAGIVAGLLLFGYGYLTGNGVSTKRAIGMMVLFILAQFWGRGYDMLNALGGVVLFLLWENPFLVDYTGLWFSVTALLGIGWVGKYFSKEATLERLKMDAESENVAKGEIFVNVATDAQSGKATKGERIGMAMCSEQDGHVATDAQSGSAMKNEQLKRKKRGRFARKLLFDLCISLWSGLGVTLTTLPVVAWCYYEIPLYSVFLNCLVIPLLTPVFVCGVLGGIVGIIFPGVSAVILYPSHLILLLYEWLCGLVGRMPFASVITGKPSVMLVIIYYVVLGAVLLLLKVWIKKRNDFFNKRILCAKLGVTIFCFLLLLWPKPKDFEITFLDVGQGDGIYISAEGNDFFIDGGSVDVRGLGEYRILPFLKSKGVSDMEYWFVTHADTDHISGLLEVLDSGYKIETLVLSQAMPKDENYEKLVSAATKAQVHIRYMKSDDVIRMENTSFICLYPNGEMQEDRNDASLVLQLNYKGMKALFTGDISSEIEKSLVGQGALEDVWLYKAAHHGSKHSNSAELLELIRPKVTVISCSSTNVYGHPSPDALRRIEAVGSKIYYTMDEGAVTILWEKGKGFVSP